MTHAPSGDSNQLIGPVRARGKYGYVDRLGRWVIPPAFETLFPVNQGVAGFLRGKALGFVDLAGNVAVSPRFEMASAASPFFSDGLCPVKERGKVGYINFAGEFVIPPQFACGGNFQNGYSVVLVDGEGAGYWLLGSDGSLNHRFAFFEVELNPSDIDWIPATIREPIDDEILMGFTNRRGQIVVRPEYRFAQEFFGDFAQVGDDFLGPFGFINRSGELVLPPKYLNRGAKFQHDLAPAAEEKSRFGFVDRNGDWQIPPQYPNAQNFAEGLAGVKVQKKWGYIGTDGEFAILPSFDAVTPFRNGFAIVQEGQFSIVIDIAGNQVFKTESN